MMKRNIYKSIDEMLASSLWSDASQKREQKKDRIFLSTRLEDMIYRDLHKKQMSLYNIEKEGTEQLASFPSLLRDAFQSFYSLRPKRNDSEILTTEAKLFNTEILETMMHDSKYPALKTICEGKELPSYEAVSDFGDNILNRLEELLLAANEKKNLMETIEKIKQQQEQLVEKVEAGIKSTSNVLTEKENETILKNASEAQRKQRQLDRLEQMVHNNLQKERELVKKAASEAVTVALEAANQTDSIISAWGTDGVDPKSYQLNRELLERVKQNERIAAIAKYLGKYRDVMNTARKNSFAYGCGDKYDIVLGKNYSRAVSSEYAYLALAETIPLFIKKVQLKSLKQYRKRERISKGYGDVVICLDESGSMEGEPIAWGKVLSLMLMESAIRNGRSCCIIRFAGIGEVYAHMFRPRNFNTKDVMDFCSSFLNGGTEFNGPMQRTLEVIEKEGFQNADMLFLTDGACDVSQEFLDTFNKKKQECNFIVTGVLLNHDESAEIMDKFCDKLFKLSEIKADDLSASLIQSAA